MKITEELNGVALGEYLSEKLPDADEGALRSIEIVKRVALASQLIFDQVRLAALRGMHGETGDVNVQGERVKKLDEYANDVFVDEFRDSGLLGTLVSEEMDHRLSMDGDELADEFLLTLDPLDGSSNIDVNITIGTVFGLFRRPGGLGSPDSALPRGNEIVACGYALYGVSCSLVFWMSGIQVCVFNLDTTEDFFVLGVEGLRIPTSSDTYSVNEANHHKWSVPTQKVVEFLRSGRDKSTSRYVGSLVADFHRNLLRGGVYLYPGEVARPEGKIRLLYEAAPLAKLVTEAGGLGSTGRERILDIEPEHAHQRCPTILGSAEVVKQIEKIYSDQSE